MRDDMSRELERKQDESPEDRAAWLQALVAEGRIRDSHVATLAATGDPGAALIAPKREQNLARFLADVGACSSGVKPFFVALAALVVDLHAAFGVTPNESILSALEDWFDLIGRAPNDATPSEATEVVGKFVRSLSPLISAIQSQAASGLTTVAGLTAALAKANPDSLLAAAKKAVAEWALSGGETIPPLETLRAEREADRLAPAVPLPMAPVDWAVPVAPPGWEQGGDVMPGSPQAPIPISSLTDLAQYEAFFATQEALQAEQAAFSASQFPGEGQVPDAASDTPASPGTEGGEAP